MAELRLAGFLTLLALAGCAEDSVPRHVDAPVAPQARPRTAPPEVGRVQTAPRVQTTKALATADDRTPSIGLVASDDDAITAALARGARRALDESRERGGPDVTLRVSEREAHWGAAAEAAVRLALDEGAVAIIAPPERERAHAIAQFGTRAQVPIVSTSPWATVMQAGSKWVSSVMPPSDEPRAALQTQDWESAGYEAARQALSTCGN